MKKLIALILLLPSLVLAQPTFHPLLWEKAAMGEIGTGVRYVKLQGWNPAITTTYEDFSPESSAIAIPTAALTTPGCISSSANDAAAGTGARTLTVYLINTSYAEVTETVTLNGTTAVALATTNVLGFNKVEVATAGSGTVNAGVIDCGVTCAAGSCTTAYVTIGVSSQTAIRAAGVGGGMVSEIFQYIVPASHTLICKNIQVGSVFATAAAGIEAVIDGSTNLSALFKRYWGREIHNTGSNPSLDPGLIVFPEKTYLKGKAAGVTGTLTGPASMSADCLLINNTWEDTSQTLF